MQTHKNEITTGILVLVTFGIFLTALVVIGLPGLIRPLKTFRVYCDNANGIRPGAPVLLAGREIGKVTHLHSPVPLDKRPAGHPNFEVAIDVRVTKKAEIYRKITVRLIQQGLMGQQVIDFIQGDASSGLAEDHTEFAGERVPDITESVADNLKRLTGPGSDLALTIESARKFMAPDADLAQSVKSAHTLMDSLNQAKIPEVIRNTEQLTDTLKREPWRVIWPSTKHYPDDKKSELKKKK
jgi:phospholipid/cholesterol/gamma-HCH transport system substrate-binding protein